MKAKASSTKDGINIYWYEQKKAAAYSVAGNIFAIVLFDSAPRAFSNGIKPGMNNSEIEKVLGKSVRSDAENVYYIK